MRSLPPIFQDKPSQYGEHTNILYGQALNTRKENMNTLFTSYHKPLFTQNLCSKDHRNQPFNPTPIKIHLPLSTTTSWKLHAQSKGFGDGSKTIQKKENAPKMSSSQEEDDDDKIPEIVFDRMIKRILASVGIPMAMGAVLLKTFDILKEKQMWDVPLWVTFITTFVFFGSSVLGVAYGSLSTSWNSENKGSLLGFQEAKENWVEMWKEEDGQKK